VEIDDYLQMSGERLYARPEKIVEVLKVIVGGANTQSEIADELDVAEQTAYNRLHDPRELDLIEQENGSWEPTQTARRVVQLQEWDAMEEPFRELTAVEEILGQLEAEEYLTYEDIGRILAFNTGSQATDDSTFRTYGRVYSQWIDILDLGQRADEGVVCLEADPADHEQSPDPLENQKGANSPRVPPEKVLECVRSISVSNCREDLKQNFGYSQKELSKTLSTCFALRIARQPVFGETELTDTGREVLTASEGKQRDLLREGLMEIPFVRAYCARAPEQDYHHYDLVEEISEAYNRGWSEKTLQTKSGRLYPWLLYTELTEEISRGEFSPTDTLLEIDVNVP